MPHIYTIGETVLDIIFENDIPAAACVGGSMLNSAVSLGRMHLPVSMITGFGTDKPGRMTNDFLEKNGVDNTMVKQDPNVKTTIALAFLDDQKKASYEFYIQQPVEKASWTVPAFNTGDLLLFGSVFSLRPYMRPYISAVLNAALKADVCSLYDPNFREAHIKDLEKLKPAIFENMNNASIVRGSDEDFKFIFGLSDPDEVYAIVSRYCQNLIITHGPDGVTVYTPGKKKYYEVPSLSAISTIGAGDSFNAGLLYGLFQIDIAPGSKPQFSEQDLDLMISCAIACASSVCQSRENYVPVNFDFRH